MMFCTHCGAPRDDAATVCTNCNQPVQRFGAQAGVHIPDPDPELAQDYAEQAA